MSCHPRELVQGSKISFKPYTTVISPSHHLRQQSINMTLRPPPLPPTPEPLAIPVRALTLIPDHILPLLGRRISRAIRLLQPLPPIHTPYILRARMALPIHTHKRPHPHPARIIVPAHNLKRMLPAVPKVILVLHRHARIPRIVKNVSQRDFLARRLGRLGVLPRVVVHEIDLPHPEREHSASARGGGRFGDAQERARSA